MGSDFGTVEGFTLASVSGKKYEGTIVGDTWRLVQAIKDDGEPNEDDLKVAEALGKLAACGSTRQIADHLLEQECIGSIGKPTRCPVAKYIQKMTGVFVHVGTTQWARDFAMHRARRRGMLPEEVHQFVVGMDSGQFPELSKRSLQPLPWPSDSVVSSSDQSKYYLGATLSWVPGAISLKS